MDVLIFMGAFFLILAFIMAIGILAVIVVARGISATDKMWANIARKFGLNYEPGRLREFSKITGVFEGVPLEVTLVARRVLINMNLMSTNHQHVINLVIRAWIPGEQAPAVAISQQNSKNRAVQGAGPDVKIGDAEFDRKVLVRGNDEQAIVALLRQPQVKAAVLKGMQTCSALRVERNWVHIERSNNLNEYLFSQHIMACVRVAQALARGAAQLEERASAPDDPGANALPETSLNDTQAW